MEKNIPDVHLLDRDIPSGKTLLAEYGDIGADDPRPIDVLDTKVGWGRTPVRLMAITAGWATADSVLRWDNGSFAVLFEVDGARHGSQYAAFEPALARFNRIPGAEIGS